MEDFVKRLKEGFKYRNFFIYAKKISKGRFHEELNMDVYFKTEDKEDFLLNIKYFSGRGPYLRKWMEIFNVKKNFYDSEMEDLLLNFISQEIKEGEKIFIEYINDEETYKFLFRGNPIYISRLGYKLFNLGFTWLKDFYFPEGLKEGLPKILAEKAINEEKRKEHLENIKKELSFFLEKQKDRKEEIILKAIKRAEKILNF